MGQSTSGNSLIKRQAPGTNRALFIVKV
jgi:hypothetical protein